MRQKSESFDEADQVTLTTYHNPERGLPAAVTQVIGDVDTPAQLAAGTGDDLTSHFTYNSYHQQTSQTDPRGNTTFTAYDSQGYPARQLDVFGNITHTSFSNGQVSGISDPEGNNTNIAYDEFGNVQTINQSNTNAGTSSSTTLEYNDFGDLVKTTDNNGNVREIQYSATGNPTGSTFTWTDPWGLLPDQAITTSNVLGPDGSVDSSLSATGQTTTVDYDALGRAYQQTDTYGRIERTRTCIVNSAPTVKVWFLWARQRVFRGVF